MEIKLEFTQTEIREALEQKGYEVYCANFCENMHVHGSQFVEFPRQKWYAKKNEIDESMEDVFQQELKAGILGTINPKHKIIEVLELVIGQELSLEEVAELSGISAIKIEGWIQQTMTFVERRSHDNYREVVKKESKLNG